MARIANDVPVSLFSYCETTIECSSIGRKLESILLGSTAGLREQTSYFVFSCVALHADKDLARAEGDQEGIGAKGDTLLWLHSEGSCRIMQCKKEAVTLYSELLICGLTYWTISLRTVTAGGRAIHCTSSAKQKMLIKQNMLQVSIAEEGNRR